MIGHLQKWAAKYTEEGRYSPVGQLFHWVMAALILFQLGWGWWMGRVPSGGDKLEAYRIHAEIGLLMFVLAGARLLWRLAIPKPVNDGAGLGWQTVVATITHVIFYSCFLALPLSGWGMWSAVEGQPLRIAGVIPWPQMPFDSLSPTIRWWLLDWAEGFHLLLVITLLLLIPMHVGAALKHHFWDQHDVLKGMLPDVEADDPPIVPNNTP